MKIWCPLLGIGNDALSDLFKSLDIAGLNQVVSDIKKFLDSSKTVGGAGCTPAAHHGGQYNGKAGLNISFVPEGIIKSIGPSKVHMLPLGITGRM